MFVGVQAIGKTSLLNKLRDEGQSVKHPSSWTDRSSQSSPSHSSSSPNISTVGIDINEWTYEKSKSKVQFSPQNNFSPTNQSTAQTGQQATFIYSIDYSVNSKFYGPITFRTWDFGGQREYYSTHQVNEIYTKILKIIVLGQI